MKNSTIRIWLIALAVALLAQHAVNAAPPAFHIEEATIADIRTAIKTQKVTATQIVEMYLKRIKAYNGVCVNQPEGVLGRITTIPNAGQLNALSTLNLRPAARKQWGFDDRKARSMTDSMDDKADMPDALEVAAAEDQYFAKTGKLIGPLHGVVMSIKDQYDTVDMRTTSGADAPYANDRPPHDSTFVKRLREAGAIIIAKANMGEYAGGDRSAFGGTFCNPYDTERSPGRSSGGSGASVAANLVTCSIGEESGPSIRNPAKNNNIVGMAATQELVSRAGMIKASFMNDRVGPMCRTVQDAARILDVIAGYDSADELTAFSVGRAPDKPYQQFAQQNSIAQPLSGVRIGVMREFMNKNLFTRADEESIDIVDREVGVLRKLGATIVDPGADGELFHDCLAKYEPTALNSQFTQQYPKLFPVDGSGKPAADHMPLLVNMSFDTSLFPKGPSIREVGNERTEGEGRYVLDAYLHERGDANIKSTEDLINKSSFFTDIREGTGFNDKKKGLETKFKDKTLDLKARLQSRFALQQIVLQCMALQNLDAVTYPTGNIPAPKLGAPTEPTVNGRSALAWTLLGANGFPAITVPAGFTTVVYDRVMDTTASSGTRLTEAIPAKLPVGIDFLGRPYSEPMLFKIAASYEAATRHRTAPPQFGPVQK